MLWESHVDAFVEWLCFTLKQQKTDLDLYLASLDGDLCQNVAGWPERLPYREVIPEETEPPERMLYLTDVETVLHLLKTGYGPVTRHTESAAIPVPRQEKHWKRAEPAISP